MSSGTPLMTVAQYAEHRGVSDSYVRRLRRQGKLAMDGRLVRVADSDKLVDQLTDPVRGGSRVDPAGADNAARGRAASSSEVQDAFHRERLAKAKMAELELGQAAKALTRADAVDRAVFTLVRQALENLQGMKGRLRDRLAAATTAADVEVILTGDIELTCTRMRAATEKLRAELRGETVVDAGGGAADGTAASEPEATAA